MKELIFKLRKDTGAGILDCQKALKYANGNFELAKQNLHQNMNIKIQDKTEREVNEGIIVSYIHSNKKLGSLVTIKCETDFVAKNQLFIQFSNDIAMQVAVIQPNNLDELLLSNFIKDEDITIDNYKDSMIAKLGENIKIDKFQYFIL